MSNKLKFNENNYTIETLEMEGKTLVYRAFEDILYIENPVDEKIQKLSIFVPEEFYQGKSINGYNIDNAPIFLPNTIGGYMPGPVERPGKNFMGKTNTTFWALLHGYVVVSAGARGRMMKDELGKYKGTAPAALCDLKAAIRYLRHNADIIPGDVEKIISNGTSAGGAMSSLLGATGNHPDYEAYLKNMGAANEKDNIFAASCYCPITNLDNADSAYEWEFNGLNGYHTLKFHPSESGEIKPTVVKGEMNGDQIELSAKLKVLFPEYLNSLNLKDTNGNELILDSDGNGTFKEFIKSYVALSAEVELNKGTDLSNIDWITINNSKVISIDFSKYIQFRTRMKPTPAFDNVSMGTPENELFGTETIQYRHFTKFSKEHSTVNGELAEKDQIKMMNPMYYIEDSKADKAKYYRIRHGSIDRDTSLAISAILAVKLVNNGINVDFAYPWGVPHSGDYDLSELFSWIDGICK